MSLSKFPIATGIPFQLGGVVRESDVDLTKIPLRNSKGFIRVRSLYARLMLTLTAGGGGAAVVPAGGLAKLIQTLTIAPEGTPPLVQLVKGVNLVRNNRVKASGRRGAMVNTAAISIGAGTSQDFVLTIPLVGRHGKWVRTRDFDAPAALFQGSPAFTLQFCSALADIAPANLASIAGQLDVIAAYDARPVVEGMVGTTVEEIPVPALNLNPTITRPDGFLMTLCVGRQNAIFAPTDQTSVQALLGDVTLLDRTDSVESAFGDFNDNVEDADELVSHVSGSPDITDSIPLVFPASDLPGAHLTDAVDLAAFPMTYKPDVAAAAYDIVREWSWRQVDAKGTPADWLTNLAQRMNVSVSALISSDATASGRPAKSITVEQRVPGKVPV